MTSLTLTVLTDEYLAASARAGKLRKDISTRFFSGRGRENCKKYWAAMQALQPRLMSDFFKDTQDLPYSKKRLYLLMRNEDGSLDLMDVELGSQEKLPDKGVTLRCLAIFKTVKL